MALAFRGRFDESIAEGTRAIELDPLSPPVLLDAALPFMFRGDTASAKKLTPQAASLDPAFFFPVMLDGSVETPFSTRSVPSRASSPC